MYVCITYIYNLWQNYVLLNDIDSKRIPRVIAFKVIICILEKQASCTLLAISLPGPLIEKQHRVLGMRALVRLIT